MNATDPRLNPVLKPGQSPGSVVLEFGTHKGAQLCALPKKYLLWIVANHPTTGLATLARHVLGDEDVDVDDTNDQTDDTPARIVLPLLIFETEQFIIRRFGRDLAALAVAVFVLDFFKDACARRTGKTWRPSEALAAVLNPVPTESQV